MHNIEVVGKINEYLHTAAKLLESWLDKMLPKVSDNWWQECVISNLSYNQREIAENNQYSNLSDFDLAALLRITDKSWYAMRNFAYLPTKDRECVREMQKVRNRWAHYSSGMADKDTVVYDINTLHAFLSWLEAPLNVLDDVDRFMQAVQGSNIQIESVQENEPVTETVSTATVNTNDIAAMSKVYLIGSPDVKGMVCSVTDLGEIKKYEVFVNGETKTFYSGQIALVEERPNYNWVDLATLQSYLTAYQINNPSAGNLYSLNAARIDFVPYQFRPALKLIKADEPRILIADSVGVGKTIEAGLIIKELEARNELENVLIICPKPLVTERKWENEMKRFDEEFVPVTGQELRQIISDTDRDGEWPVRYNKTIIPYSILDSRVYQGEEGKKGKSYGLSDLDPAPHFDLVIIDEAHHIRNGSMDKEKAFAYKCVKYFCEHADAVVMLTATPLQTGDNDLFTLLNVLRPDVVIDKDTFVTMSKPNEYISRCSHIIRGASEGWQLAASEELQGVLQTQWGVNVIAKNPLYAEVLKKLAEEDLSREDRVKLISDVESLHGFATMLNRTRRRDIQDFCVRRTHTIASDFTPEQAELHNELLAFEYAALSTLHNVCSVPFMMSTIRRQAASCIFGLAPYVRDILERRLVQLEADSEDDVDNAKLSDYDISTLSAMASHVLELADSLPEEDPKFDSVLEIIKEKQTVENNKIILFSTFRHTLAYLKKKLRAEGLRVEQIDGSVKDDARYELRKQFELPKEDENAIDILLFTEVGSEGLDYQFCDMMINYDLPWNPMRIEQRIGRIDRRGQKSEVVNIYNVITNNTVDADIYERCLLRIGIFEKSIGECEAILSEIGAQVEKIAVNATLTDEERRSKLEQMADNEVRRVQELNKLEDEEKELFGFDLSGYHTSQEIQEAESPWLSPTGLQYLVTRYLNDRLGVGNYILGESEIKTLRLNKLAREALREDFKKLSTIRSSTKRDWDNYLKDKNPNHAITFDSEAAEKDRKAFFITAVHPLVRQAAQYYATNQTSYINLRYSSDTLPAGTYHFSVYAWNYIGLNPCFKIVPVCENDAVAAELTEILQTAEEARTIPSINASAWSKLEEKQIVALFAERKKHQESVGTMANYKLESIRNNYINRKVSLETQIDNAVEMNLIRMYQSMLDGATEAYEAKVASIKKKAGQADIHTSLIANGVLTIER